MKFDTMKNGYNRYQVDDELNKAYETIDQLQRQLVAYQKQADIDSKQILELSNKLNDVSRNMDAREKAVKDLTSIALNEANVIVSNANSNADMIVKEALLSARAILVQISKLGIEAKEIKVNLNEQLSLLTEAIDGFDVPPIPDPELINKY